jgi:hypothetical protein
LGEVGREWCSFGEPHGDSSGVAGRVLAGERAGAGDGKSEDLADEFPPIALGEGEAEHDEMDAGVRPRPRLGDHVRSFE